MGSARPRGSRCAETPRLHGVRSPPPTTSPKRRESSTAIGRAPIAKMSRRMPPTPVAAPWKGSTAEGWLCDSTLNAHTSPPPTSTAPAFSPGPITTCGPSVGSVRSSRLECLYAQCSLHSSEYIASSTWLGAPPCFSQTSSYSARVRPRARASSTVGRTALSDTGPPSRRRCSGPAPRAGAHRSQARAPSTARRIDSKMHRPSVEPVSSSTACSGWGISPNTLPAALRTPAMSRSEPLKLWPGA